VYQYWYCGTKPDREAVLSCEIQSTSGLLISQSDILSKGSMMLSSAAPNKITDFVSVILFGIHARLKSPREFALANLTLEGRAVNEARESAKHFLKRMNGEGFSR